MELTRTIKVEFDLVLNADLFEGHAMIAQTHVSFNYDLNLTADAALEAAVTDFLNTEEMAEQEREAGHVLVNLIASQMNTKPCGDSTKSKPCSFVLGTISPVKIGSEIFCSK